jgi:hypothetical protein
VRGTSRAFVNADHLNVDLHSHAMIHYNVWFALKDGTEEKSGLATVSRFLMGLCTGGEVAAFRLLRNTGKAGHTKLPQYHAIVEFADLAAMSQAMGNQVARGIHNGAHGEIVKVVRDFRVEIFELFAPDASEAMQYACEI